MLTKYSILVSAAVSFWALLAPAKAVTIGNPLIERPYATDNAPNALVVDFSFGQSGTLTRILTYAQTGEAAENYPPSSSMGLSFDAYVLSPTSNPNEYSVLFATGPLTPTMPDAVNSFSISPFNVQANYLLAHYGQGIPLTIGGGSALTYYPSAPLVVGTTVTIPNLYSNDRTYSIAAQLPDGGMTVALLGFSLTSLGLIRRKLNSRGIFDN